MKRLRIAIAFGAFLALGFMPQRSAPQGCNQTIKPLTPLGCKDLVARCVCDSQGKNCHVEWGCVR
jgi:hypothetical protein